MTTTDMIALCAECGEHVVLERGPNRHCMRVTTKIGHGTAYCYLHTGWLTHTPGRTFQPYTQYRGDEIGIPDHLALLDR